MTLFVLAYLGGVLTIVSACILPVLPFVFARSDRPFVNSSLPILAGMAATFAAVAALAAVGGGWAVEANQYGRIAALALLALLGITLLFPTPSDQMTWPLVALGSRLSQSAEQGAGAAGSTVVRSLLLGVATGLLWAPLRRSGIGPDSDGSGPSGGERPYFAAIACIRGRGGDVAGACPPCRGTGFAPR